MVTWHEEIELTGRTRSRELRRWFRPTLLVEQVEVRVMRCVGNPTDVDTETACIWRDRRVTDTVRPTP